MKDMKLTGDTINGRNLTAQIYTDLSEAYLRLSKSRCGHIHHTELAIRPCQSRNMINLETEIEFLKLISFAYF